MINIDRPARLNLLSRDNWISLLKTPSLLLNYDYNDIAFFALLAYIKKPGNILDLGSYTGFLPFLVERVTLLSNSSQRYNWTLVDDSRYLSELRSSIIDNNPLSGKGLKEIHKTSWLRNKVSPAIGSILNEHGDYYLPPVEPDEFADFWKKFSLLADIEQPQMSMYKTLESIPPDFKFDLVHFDLAAGNPENLEVFDRLQQNYLKDDAIVVFDDVEIAHPKMFLMFLDIIEKTEYRPIAIGMQKIAVMNRAHKDAFLDITSQLGLLDFGSKPFRDKSNEAYRFFLETSSRWGHYLNLRAKT
jgi:predicted O-methyltransferase YrrM